MYDLHTHDNTMRSRAADAGAAPMQSSRWLGINAEQTTQLRDTTALAPRSNACVNPLRCPPLPHVGMRLGMRH